MQSIHKTSYFNRLAALPFRKLLIFNGLHPTAFKVLVLGCGTDFALFLPLPPTRHQPECTLLALWICASACVTTVAACYADYSTEKSTLPTSDLLPSLLFKINENQLALEAAIMEMTNWVEQRGSAEVADNVRGALAAIDRNEEFIKMALAVLMTPE